MKHTLKELHEKAKRTHADIAKEVGISRPFYTQILAGKERPSLPVARRIAQVFRVSLDEIIFGVEVDNINQGGEKKQTYCIGRKR
ncbi:MAG: helix-turn-helix domain-containing protein [Bacillota bacterium]